MPVGLGDIAIPDFGLPLAVPTIPAATYDRRARQARESAGCDWLAVYADREHTANLTFLCGYDPRFEEALLLLGPRGQRVLIVGNEGLSYAPLAVLPGLETALAQSLSLMGQDRSSKPDLGAVLREAGLRTGDSIGLVGWKYIEAVEWLGEGPAFYAPHAIVAQIARAVGGMAGVKDATPVLMHPIHGLRSVADVDQIALHEWGAARASAAVWRVLAGARPGESEMEAAARMAYAGEPLTAHVMLASAPPGEEVIGLRSPGARRLARGDGVTCGVGYWGELSARAGLITESDDDFLTAAAAYFMGLIAWYETADIGVAGGAIFEAVGEALAMGGLRSALNPGHLTGLDEWSHTPVRPGSPERIASGMPFQVDVIPVPMQKGWALNCEDGVVFADAALRAGLAERHPDVAARIEGRRRFARDALGVTIRDTILPLSSTPLCLAPFWLAPGHLLARR